MRFIGAGLVTLLLMSAVAACSGSNETGSSGGWRVSGAHIRVAGVQRSCPTPAPVVDTFMSTPTPNPNCTPAPGARSTAGPTATPAPRWRTMQTQSYRSTTQQEWHPIYTTYTAPPGTGVYQPMVHATQQPMPTPFTTPTPARALSPTPLPTLQPAATTPPSYVPTPYPSYVVPTPTP